MDKTNKDKKELATNRLLDILRGEAAESTSENTGDTGQNDVNAGRNAEGQVGLSEKEQSALTGRPQDYNTKKFAPQNSEERSFVRELTETIFMKIGFGGLMFAAAALLVLGVTGWYFIFYTPEKSKSAELKQDIQTNQGEFVSEYATFGIIDSLRQDISELQEQTQKSIALTMPKDSMLYALRILEERIIKQNQEIAREAKQQAVQSDTTDVYKALANMTFRGSVEYGSKKIALINDGLYETGDIVNGFKIIEIHPDRVVLEDRDGTGYTLR